MKLFLKVRIIIENVLPFLYLRYPSLLAKGRVKPLVKCVKMDSIIMKDSIKRWGNRKIEQILLFLHSQGPQPSSL